MLRVLSTKLKYFVIYETADTTPRDGHQRIRQMPFSHIHIIIMKLSSHEASALVTIIIKSLLSLCS